MVKHTTIPHNVVYRDIIYFRFFVLFYFVFVYVGVCSVHFYRDQTIFARHRVHYMVNIRTMETNILQTPIYKTVANAKKFTIFPHQIENLLNHVRPVAHPNEFQQIKL